MASWLVAILIASLIVVTLQEDCAIIFNNVHNGYRYKINGDCDITNERFLIVPLVQQR